MTGHSPQVRRIHPSAEVHAQASVGEGTVIWHSAQVREGACIGAKCVIGRGAYLGVGVRVGDRVKIQNYALIYEPAELEDGVFVGPAVVLTNDRRPRAITAAGAAVTTTDWTPVGVTVRRGASIGAGSVCVAPLVIGRWAMVAAGAVVTRDVPDFALVAGNPAKHVGWVGRAGVRLRELRDTVFQCPRTGQRYQQSGEILEEVGQ